MTNWTDTISAGKSAPHAGKSASSTAIKLRAAVVVIIERFAVWRDRVEERRQLARLDERLLKDIGVSRADAQRETDKPFWRQ